MVEPAHRQGRFPRRDPFRRLPGAPGHFPQHPHPAAEPPGGQRDPQARPLSDHPPRSEYRLTGKGRDLWHVVTAMRQWGDRWAAPGGPPLEIRHTACGHVVTAVPTCSHCGEPPDARSVTAVPGPGAAEGDFGRTLLSAVP